MQTNLWRFHRTVTKGNSGFISRFIFTDPPYGKEYLPLYEELAKLAVRVLKPGGSLVFLIGHIILDEVIHNISGVFFKNNNSRSEILVDISS